MKKQYDNMHIKNLLLLINKNSERHSGMIKFLISKIYKKKTKRMLLINTDKNTKKKLRKLIDWYDRMWKMKIINNQHYKKNSLILFNKYLVSQFSSIKRETRLTPERLEKMQIKKLLWLREREMLVEILHKHETILTWNFDDIEKIKKEITLLMKI